MNCRTTVQRLNPYLDGELSAEEAAVVEEHLAACPQCRAELDDLRRINGALEALGGMAAPADFARRVRGAADRRRKPIRLFGVVGGRRSRALARLAAALVMAAGLWTGLMAGDSAFRSRDTSDEVDAETAEFELSMDLFSAVPAGSLADVYLTFVDEAEWGGAEDVQ